MSEKPFVPEKTDQREFTLRAVLLGLVMTVILGAANAYLGLRAGMTIAATYPAAVIGMAVLKMMKGSILEENMARTVGSIGESVAAGAIFTIPAFLITGVWTKFNTVSAYLQSTALMFVGGLLGILFVTFLRRIMVTDPELPFPESVAAAEIHKAGQKGSAGAKFLFQAMGVGALIYSLGVVQLFSAAKEFIIKLGKIGSSFVRLGASKEAGTISTGGVVSVSGPGISPAYVGVGYIIGPRLASLNFAGGVLAWGLFAPLLMYFLGPQLIEKFYGPAMAMADVPWPDLISNVWKFIIRPIAVGGMLVGAGYTLFKMRKNLMTGIKRSIGDVKKAAGQTEATSRLEKDLNIRLVLFLLLFTVILMVFVYKMFIGSYLPAILAAVVMAVFGFFFAAVSGNLVGTIGSSNNPISGLTLSTLIIAGLLMVLIGARGTSGIIAVLGVASVVCVSSAVAGEMLQDLKVGHILGGTPWKMQVGDILGVLVASLVLYFPLMILHGAFTFGSKDLPAPQAGLMAAITQGIVGGEMAWPLVIVGMMMGFALILVRVSSPMLVSVGMYLPLETTFAIFIGGMIKGILDRQTARKKLNPAQKARAENVGVLLAAGLIAGEALTGLVRAGWKFFYLQGIVGKDIPIIFAHPSYLLGLAVLVLIGLYLVAVPLRNAGAPDEPPPPSAVV
ncbi:MAG TPA: oligopeptide transporter, OPT family [Candidatus Saccharicenans sp.]|nr:oligopeptide transporter, OPT family [Candidatus Saccharicenans sp.]HUM79137.1 oligopeptide transporter, OPT family [Candidatus Saccharicenans sp.]